MTQNTNNTVPFYAEDKIAVFIDGANLYSAAKNLNFDIDYKRLLSWLANKGRMVRTFYYTALLEDSEYSPLRPLVDWLDYNGYHLVTKPTREYTDEHGRKKLKGNMDIELAIDMMEIADKVDHVLLFSGDGDFKSLIEAVQRKGVRVTVISTIYSNPSMIADELRRQADHFIDLKSLKNYITRSDKEGRPEYEEQPKQEPAYVDA